MGKKEKVIVAKLKCSNKHCGRVGPADTFDINKADKPICKGGCNSYKK